MNNSQKTFASIVVIAIVFLTDQAIFQICQNNEVEFSPYFITAPLWSLMCAGLWLLWRQNAESVAGGNKPRVGTLTHFNHQNIEEAICSNIRANLVLYGSCRAVIGDSDDALLVKWVIDNEYISKAKLERAVHDGICQVGRGMFEWCLANPSFNRPDHATSPEALGYAIKHGVISSEEVKLLQFDMGDTPEGFIKSSEGLLESVMSQLAAGTAFFDISALPNFGDCHDACCC